MKMLVTGATGFIGRALCRQFGINGRWFVSAVRRSSGVENEVVVGEISGTTDWSRALADCEVVIHLAACTPSVREAASGAQARFTSVNVEGTLNLARQAARVGVRRFVFLSSVKVNGEGSGCCDAAPRHASATVNEGMPHGFSETDVPAPKDIYGVSKYTAEMGLMAISRESEMEIVIVRPPVVYGPGVKGNFAAMSGWVRKGIPLPFGAVHNRRSMVALENLVSFIELCADRSRAPQAANEIFLVSDGEDVSTTELLRKVARAYSVTPRLIGIPSHWMCFIASMLRMRAPADRLLGSLVVNSSKARDVLGWRPVISMDEQLDKMARHDPRS